MIKEVEIKNGQQTERHGITLSDAALGKGLKRGEDGESVEVASENLIKTTYAELKALRDDAKLNAGSYYRITDYVTTTTQSETKSANHPFDVIVLALSENTLCEDAKAILHEGDTYFADSDLSAWELKYCLDNDKTRFEWADETNGKGVIYRMIDEKRNDCPYDFKNILIKNEKYTDSAVTKDKFYYTFAYVVKGVLYDGTVEAQVKNCYGNLMKERKKGGKVKVNLNVFKNTSFGDSCYSNTFGDSCYYNTFGNSCYSNTFGDSCFSNTFGNSCYSNTFGDSCYYNTFGNSCYSNTFGDSCYSNTFGDSCNSNTFGDYCYSNTFGNSCYSNTFGNSCYSNTFGNSCYSNTFGDSCYSNTFGDSCYSNTFGDSCNYNTFGNYCYYNRLSDTTQNRKLEGGSEKTVINLSEEFYDDGSGQLVPTKHPDLSTQPSILPYKFMGQYVYEQLIPHDGDPTHTYMTWFEPQDLAVQNPVFLEAQCIMSDGVCPCSIVSYGVEFEAISTEHREGIKYIRVVYTSMPEEDGYYGYNNYGGGNIADFSNAVVLRFAGNYNPGRYYVYFIGVEAERINDTTYVYKNLSSVSKDDAPSILIKNGAGNAMQPTSVKIYLDGVELDSTRVEIRNDGVITFKTPLPIYTYNTVEAIINI